MMKERILAAARYHIKKGQKIYVQPNIPGKKLDNALNSYAGEIGREDILVLLDTTLFGSGKEGLVATAEGLYWRLIDKPAAKSEPPSFFPFSKLETVSVEGKFPSSFIQLNDDIKITLNISNNDLKLLFNFLESVVVMAAEGLKKSAAEDSKQAAPQFRIDPQAAYFEKTGLLGEERISELLTSLGSPDGLSRQLDSAIQMKKKQARGNIGAGFGAIGCGILLAIYPIIGLFVYLPFRTLVLIVVPIAIIGGIAMILKATAKSALASKTKLTSSIEDACKKYYETAFCTIWDKRTNPSRLIEGFPELFPAQVHNDYKSNGWRVFQSESSSRLNSIPMNCSGCGKKSDYGVSKDISIPVENEDLKKSLFLKCEHCQGIFCYECIDRLEPVESRFLCPTCGRSTLGAYGLDLRWVFYRLKYSDTKSNFDLRKAEINLRPRSDPRIQDVDITLTGGPFGEVKFRNISFNIDGNWFLATPEPVVGS